MPGLGVVSDISGAASGPPPFVPSWRSLPGLACLYEAAQETGSNGDSLATIFDRSGNGVDMTAAANKVTYSAAGFLSKPAYALSGSQYETTATPILAGALAACSIVWVGTFADAAARAAFSFGIGSGFAFTSNVGGSGKREILYSGVGINSADNSTTSPEMWIFTYASGAGTKSHLRVNGAAKTLTVPNLAALDPAVGSVFGALTTGIDALLGFTALLLATTNVITAPQIAQIEADAQTEWGGIF